MKSRFLMAALIVTLLMGARVYAGDCGPCDPACDPCGACNGCAKSCDLFSGLKSLVACKPCAVTECGPCDGVVACSPCDVVDCGACDACGDVGCGCGPKFTFGKRLKRFFAVKSCDPCGPCNTDCDPCGEVGCCDGCGDCGPCDDVGCDTGCGDSCFTLRKFFRGFRFGKCGDCCADPCGGCCDTDCGPCDGCCDTGCGPCDGCCDTGCGPCDGCCDTDCGACDGCDTGCGRKFGRFFDRPRYRVKKFFDGFFVGKCKTDCGPCDPICCDPCEPACCDPCAASCCNGHAAPASQLPEAAN